METQSLNERDKMILRLVGEAIRSEFAALRKEIDARFESQTGGTSDALIALSAKCDKRISDEGDELQQRLAELLRVDLVELDERITDSMATSFDEIETRLSDAVCERFESSLMDVERRAILSVQAAIPAPRDGRDGKDGRDGTNGRDGKDGAAGADGVFTEPKQWNGRAARGELIVFRGGLWYARADNAAPPVAGNDWQLLCNGIAGAQMHATAPGELGVMLELSDGEHAGEVVHVPGIKYCGTWTKRAHETGDCVTRDGGMWIAERDTDGRPGETDSGWRLAVKRGADGRDGHSFDWCGDYRAGRTHKRGDVVRAPSGIFVAIKTTESAPPFHADRSDDWEVILRAGSEFGESMQ